MSTKPRRSRKRQRPTDDESDSYLSRKLVAPLPAREFFDSTYQKRAVHFSRNDPKHFADLFSLTEVMDLVRAGKLKYNSDLDIAYVKDGKRLSPSKLLKGPADLPTVKKHWQNGCSLRLRAPQEHSEALRKVIWDLEDSFACKGGVNVYATPANSQGFAPHFDDVDVFMCQIEGSKQWRLWRPPNLDDVLARFSSEDFLEKNLGKPDIECFMHPGDVIYMPRGTIHRGISTGKSHSLHVTLSVSQLTTWADLLKSVADQAIESIAKENVAFRESVPRDFAEQFGLFGNAANPARRQEIEAKVKNLLRRAWKHTSLDKSADTWVLKRFFPGRRMPDAKTSSAEITRDDSVRLASRHGVRVTRPDGSENLHVFFPLKKAEAKSESDKTIDYNELEVAAEFERPLRNLCTTRNFTRVPDLLTDPAEGAAKTQSEDAVEDLLDLLNTLSESFCLIETKPATLPDAKHQN